MPLEAGVAPSLQISQPDHSESHPLLRVYYATIPTLHLRMDWLTQRSPTL